MNLCKTNKILGDNPSSPSNIKMIMILK